MDASNPPNIFLFGPFRLDRRTGLSRRSDAGSLLPVSLGSRAIDVLCVLVERHGDLVSRDEIMATVWPNTTVEEANLSVQISALRRVLDQDRTGGSCIQTVPGRGYRFVEDVSHPPASARESENVVPTAGAVPDAIATGVSIRRLRPWGATAAVWVIVGLVGAGAATAMLNRFGWFSAPRPRLSIVVLPFANISSDPEQGYIADAITDDLTTDLSRISGSVVIAHSTAQTYRDKKIDVRQIGHDLDVRYVLEGSVRRTGGQVEVNAQLIDAESGTHVWADRFETDQRSLADAQSEITGRLAHTLDLQLVEADDRRIEQQKHADLDANDLTMRGWALWYQPFSVARRQAALRSFEQALEIDPQSIDAKVGIAEILVSNIGVGSSQSPSQDGARADGLLLQAIEQDANISRAHEVLGTLRRIENRLDEARIEFETAVALDRNNAHALLGLGQTLMFLGRPGDGLPMIEGSMRLDPLDPNIAFGHWSLGTCHLLLSHLELATDLLRKAQAENPRVFFFSLYLAAALGLHGDGDEAREALAASIQLKPEIVSVTKWVTAQPWIGNQAFRTLREGTIDIGLHRAGMPDQ